MSNKVLFYFTSGSSLPFFNCIKEYAKTHAPHLEISHYQDETIQTESALLERFLKHNAVIVDTPWDGFRNPTASGNALAMYSDLGYSVATGYYTHCNGTQSLSGRFITDEYHVFVDYPKSTYQDSQAQTFEVKKLVEQDKQQHMNHPLFKNVSSFSYSGCSVYRTTVNRDAEVLGYMTLNATSPHKLPLCAERVNPRSGGLIMGFSITLTASFDTKSESYLNMVMNLMDYLLNKKRKDYRVAMQDASRTKYADLTIHFAV